MYKIYKLVFRGEVVYVGRTKQSLEKRKKGGYASTVPFYKECEIELIEETDDVSRERYWIEYFTNLQCPLLNRTKGDGLDYKEHSRKFREENREYFRNYHREYIKTYYEENKERITELRKKYAEENKEKIKEYHKSYYEKNKEELNENAKKYNEENLEKLREYRRNYYREYYHRKKEKSGEK